MTAWSWPGSRILRVIDGDSVVAQLSRDVGFHGVLTFQQRLRLNRINAAPADTPDGQRATLFVQTWVLRGLLSIDTVKPYKFGDEWMAEVTDGNGVNLSDDLVQHGLAAHWDGTGPRPLGVTA